jgi:AraC-like DNA-binding protein
MKVPMAALTRAASLTSYAAVARRAGLNPHAMLRKVGIDPAVLSEPDQRIPALRVLNLLEETARASGRATIGIEMAESRQLSDFGALSLLLSHQRTLRDILGTLVQYLHVLNESLAVQIERSADLVIIREEIVAELGGATRQATELAVGVMFRLCRTLLGTNWKPDSVHFVHKAPKDLAVYHRVFGMKPQFGSSFCGIVCAAADLDKPNPSADPVMARYAQQFVQAMPGAASRSVLQEVRKAIYLLLPMRRATIEQVASGLGMNSRMLQRQLEAEGEIFSALLNGVRRDLVARYMKNENYSLTEISALLGFSHSSAFSRWYHAQFGISPRRSRTKSEQHG